MTRLKSNYYHFIGHTAYKILDTWWDNFNEENKFFLYVYSKYRVWISVSLDSNHKLYWWQEKYYG